MSKDDESATISAYTLYGFSGQGRCCAKPEFIPGAPKNTCCGTTCGSIQFPERYSDKEVAAVLQEFENDLPAAAEQAMEDITWCSHVCCTNVDRTANRAAQTLNHGWCEEWNNRLVSVGLRCHAASEVFGFGRSRATYFVIRISPSRAAPSASMQ